MRERKCVLHVIIKNQGFGSSWVVGFGIMNMKNLVLGILGLE
jgi:hypothetical protein